MNGFTPVGNNCRKRSPSTAVYSRTERSATNLRAEKLCFIAGGSHFFGRAAVKTK